MKSISKILLSLVILALIGLAWYVGRKFQLPGKQTQEQAEVILEKVKSVCKLVTAEGYYSEVYDYKDYYHWDVSLFRKKALIRVKARVSVGYDLETIQIHADEATKTIQISELPPLQVIATDHDLDYYDISEGTFNSFSADDLTKLNTKAKEYIEQVALSGELVKRAEGKSNELFDIIRFMVEQAGWNLQIMKSENPPQLLN